MKQMGVSKHTYYRIAGYFHQGLISVKFVAAAKISLSDIFPLHAELNSLRICVQYITHVRLCKFSYGVKFRRRPCSRTNTPPNH